MKSNYDGYFNLLNKEDGLYIQLIPSKQQGKSIDINDIIKALENQKIINYDSQLLEEELKLLKEQKEFKISDAVIQSIDESIEINISKDKLTAYIRFYKPIGEGRRLTLGQIYDELNNKKVIYGINKPRIEQLINEVEYNKDIEIARGKEPTKGKDAIINYYFENQKKIKPHMNEDGTVDYHKLNLITNVKSGDALAKLIHEESGINGENVYGEVIPASKVNTLKLNHGKNTKLKDDILYATSDGQVKIDDGKIVVLDYLEIPGNVDNSTGDIEFLGTVIVKGNVLTGYSIKAKGDVEVKGVVEGAHITADGNIILHRGMQGMDRGVIETKGNVMAKYIENSKVIAGGFIHSDAILHSNVSCKEEVLVDGKKGLISGGSIRSGKEISAKVIGSSMETVTTIDVGIDPTFIDDYNKIQKEIKQLSEEEIKLTQIITLLNKKKQVQGKLEEDKKEMLISATRSKIFISNKLSNNKIKQAEMFKELSNKNLGKVKILGNIYPGVRVTIGNVKYYVRDVLQYCIMYQDGADIKVASYS
ncbi:MAG: FapA family protein [Vallitalea sp.]|jgi:uncharacterized protein (DUF342 family)|nr:FapA family protein [Vallitalea sp.]